MLHQVPEAESAPPANAASTPTVDDTAAEWQLQTKVAEDRCIAERCRLAF
jgi:hypothetical protein